MTDTRKYCAVKTTRLSSALAVGATSIVVAEVKDREGNTLAMTDFGTKAWGVIDPGSTNEEMFSFTGISSTTLSGVSTVLMKTPYTETSGLTKAHAAGVKIVIQTNAPAFYNESANRLNDETITETWTFTAPNYPRMDSVATAPTDDEQFATKKYADDLALAGAPDSTESVKGVVECATSAEVAAGDDTGGTTGPTVVRPSKLAEVIQKGSFIFAIEDGTGSDDTYTANLTPAITAYTEGMLVAIKFTVANTGGATLNLNGVGAANIQKYVTGALASLATGDIVANQTCLLYYNGSVWVMLNPTATLPTTALLTEMANFFGATNISGAEAETLTDGSDAGGLHYHLHTIVQGTRDITASSGAVTYAHGLGRIPKYIEIVAFFQSTNTFNLYQLACSHGFSNGSSSLCTYQKCGGDTGGSYKHVVGNDASNCVYIHKGTAGDANAYDQQTAVATFDATNITLTWTETVGSTGAGAEATGNIAFTIYVS